MSSPSSSSSSGSAMLRPAFRDLSPACDDAPLVSAAEGSGVFFAGDWRARVSESESERASRVLKTAQRRGGAGCG
eukprot:3000927-Rhodomonas_salina.2